MRGKILITDTVPEFVLDEIRALGFVPVHRPGILYAEFLGDCADYEGIMIRSGLDMDEAIFEAATKLKFVLRPGSGLDNLDIDSALHHNITIINSPEGNSHSVGEHAIGMLLALLHNIPRSIQEVSHLKWLREENRGTELRGKIVGILGYGNTGGAFARKLQGFEVDVFAYDKYLSRFSDEFVRESTFEEIFEHADILSLHIPLTRETRHLVNYEFLSRFKKPIYLINTSRGKVVKSADVLAAIKDGKILGAALDVLETEPLSYSTPGEIKMLREMLDSGKVIITPHIAGWTHESGLKIFSLLFEKLKQHLQQHGL